MRPPVADYGLALARTVATRSEDPYHQVGAVLLRQDSTIASVGYNGAPPGVEIDWSDRDARRDYVIHAEANALRYVTPGEAKTMCVTMKPCDHCVLLLAANGVRLVLYEDDLDPKVYDLEKIARVAEVVGVTLLEYK